MLKLLSPDLHDRFYAKRNKNMLKKTLESLQRDENPYVAVGLSHLFGSSGIIQGLRDSGYTVKKIPASIFPWKQTPQDE